MGTTEYIAGGYELLDLVAPLWRELMSHHSKCSKHFKKHFETASFDGRKKGLAKKKALRVEYAKAGNANIGYCITSVSADGTGEIESLFISAQFRRNGVATALMQHAIAWLDQQQVGHRIIGVAVGNEAALPFYAKFGFLPRSLILQHTPLL